MNNESATRIGFWDIETSYLLMAAFSRYELHVAYSQVFQEWFTISACYKLLGEDKIHHVSILDDKKRFEKDFTDDYYVIKKLREFIDSVDILIAHNGDNFDWKKFKAKLIKYKMPPVKKPILIDTYKEAKTAHFTSNKLGDLAKFLSLNNKSHSNSGDWLLISLPYGTYGKVIVTKKTKTNAIKRVLKYNKADIPPLEDLYLELRPYMTRHPNLNQFHSDLKVRCKNCGSSNMLPHGSSCGYIQWKCGNCGHKSRSTTRVKKIVQMV